MIFLRITCVLYSLIIVEIFDSLLIEQKYIQENFDGNNITYEIVFNTSGNELSCSVHCSGMVSCVAFLYSYSLQTCLLLDNSVTKNPINFPSNRNWLYFSKNNDCPASWIRNEDSSYCFVKKGLQWSSSKESCISMGAHLLAIETELEKTWIQDKASGDSWWIGGTDSNSEGTFYWEHSSKNMTYTNWYSNQPDNDTIGINENCVSMVRSGYWHDYPCNHTFYYICEK